MHVPSPPPSAPPRHTLEDWTDTGRGQRGSEDNDRRSSKVMPLSLSLPLPSSTVLNGSSHSPTSLNGAPSTPNGFSNGPAMSSTASLSNQQLPPACGARQLCKLKRFLTTLQQFGNDISPEIGERVRSLVLGLVVSLQKHDTH